MLPFVASLMNGGLGPETDLANIALIGSFLRTADLGVRHIEGSLPALSDKMCTLQQLGHVTLPSLSASDPDRTLGHPAAKVRSEPILINAAERTKGSNVPGYPSRPGSSGSLENSAILLP